MSTREHGQRRCRATICLIAATLAAMPLLANNTTRPGGDAKAADGKAVLPAAVDLRPEFKKLGLPPRSQGGRPTCSVFTTVGAMEFAASKHFGRPTVLSVEYLNWACNQVIHNKTESRGQFFRHLLAGFERYGICLESDMPYTPRFEPDNEPSEAARKRAKEIQALGLEVHPLAPRSTEEDDPDLFKETAVLKVKETLARGYPVAAGSHHSLLLVGYTDDPGQPGGGVFIARDSGTGRYDSVTYEHVQKNMGGFFCVEPPAGLVPFVLPWDDGSPGPTDLSFLSHTPAGKFGAIQARPDGHFYAGDRRIRFFGVNLCFAATLPAPADADKIAARMAKFGINVVRFHHMDAGPFPGGLIRRGDSKSGELDPEALDRLGGFLDRLKAHGIYADLNLLTSRHFRSADGLPREIDDLDWKLRHAIGMYFPAMIELQKQYAHDLLSYRNPHTGLVIAADPAIAIVEINNENGMIQQWLGGDFDHLPKPFADELSRQWNVWLKTRYKNTADLRKAWEARREPLGRELLNNPSGPGKLGGWNLEQHEEAVAKAQIEQDVAGQSAALGIHIEKPGTEGWHVQFVHPGLEVKAGQLHALSFVARADPPRRIEVNLGQAHEPWGTLGFQQAVELTPEWTEHRFSLTPNAADANARLSFTGLGRQTGAVWFAAVSLRSGGETGPREAETIEQGSLPLVLRNDPRGWPAAAREAFIAFLRDTEDAYWRTMREYVKERLGFKGIVMGTITDCSPPTLQARFDAVDGHAYWQHPDFHGQPWDPEDWTVRNMSMVNEPGGTLARLAMKRVAGKPFTVTEYNHPSPNTYGSEGPLLLAAYGALQDWDGLFIFAYAHGADWDSRKIDGFFDTGQHPAKMVNLAAAALMFRAAHLTPAKELVSRDLSPASELSLLALRAHPWGMIGLAEMGVNPATALLHRTATRTVSATAAVPPVKDEPAPPDLSLLVSDTHQLTWDRREKDKGVVTVNSPRTKAVIGFAAGRSFDLGGVTVTPGKTLQDWCTISLSLVEGESFAKPGRILLVATGSAENTGMHWKDAEHSSVGRQWGGPPSLVEVIPATVRLPVPPDRLNAWPLDDHGQRSNPLKVQPAADGGSQIEIGGGPTLWYELAIK